MLHYFSKQQGVLSIQQLLAGLVIAAMIASALPPQMAAAQTSGDGSGETATTTDDGTGTTTDDGTGSTDDGTGTSTDDGTGTTTDDGTGTTTDDGTGTTTDDGTSTTTDDGTGTSTDDGTGTTTNDGTDGSTGDTSPDGASGTTTDDGTGTTTDDGTTGPDGSGGTDGSGTPTTTVQATPEDPGEPVEVISGNDIGEDPTPDDGEGVTGNVIKDGSSSRITTGDARAQGELYTDANSTDVRSSIEDLDPNFDLDTYTFTATGTNTADVENIGGVFSLTGENEATADNTASIYTGNAISAFNIANVINSTVVNSDGFVYLKNQILDPGTSLDMRSLFFPDEEGVLAGATDCNLLSCVAEDIVYNYTQTNHATITNNANISAITGKNKAGGQFMNVVTGDAWAGGNVINVVNTNIVDSNYRLMTYNAIGDLDGDLLLPREELFDAFFGRPNGVTQLETIDDFKVIDVENDNDAVVDNNVDSNARTGDNSAVTTYESDIETGRAESESNVVNKVNENTTGGDSMFILIRVHGFWGGDVVGLPDGLAWDETQEGIIIYNEDTEIAPSELLPYDVDSYTANLKSFNRTHIKNNLDITAITGENHISGFVGEVETGDAFASANVLNIANTNVIGTNWTMAVINIMGDFDGNITFTATDLSLSGELSAADDPLEPGSDLTYTYTVTNNGDVDATNVKLTQTLSRAQTESGASGQSSSLGTLAPGESRTVTLTGRVDPDLPPGTYTVSAVASINSDVSDGNEADNALLISRQAISGDPDTDIQTSTTTDESGTTTDDGTGTTTDDGTGTTTDDGSDLSSTGEEGGNTDTTSSGGGGGGNSSGGGGGGSSGGGGGGGGGGSSNKTKKIDRSVTLADPDDPPMLVVTKEAVGNEDGQVNAGDSVDYLITVTNRGGTAYDAIVYDTLYNPIDVVLSEDSWDLGTLLPGEVIEISYTTQYNVKTPSGTYTNVATVEAYRHEDGKENGDDPLELDEAQNVIEIDGVALAVGNVQPIVYFPQSDGNVGALISWQTNRPALAQVFYSPEWWFSLYSPYLNNFGYMKSSFKFSTEKTNHYMILTGLQPGQRYEYRIRATADGHVASGGDYYLSVPSIVNRLTLAIPTGQPQVAGATAYGGQTPNTPAAPSSSPTPYAAPAPAPKPVTDPAPEPEPEPAPEPAPEPEPETNDSESDSGGIVKKATDAVFGFFGL